MKKLSVKANQALILTSVLFTLITMLSAAFLTNDYLGLKRIQQSLIEERVGVMQLAAQRYFQNPNGFQSDELQQILLSQAGEGCSTLFDNSQNIIVKAAAEGYTPDSGDIQQLVDINYQGQKVGELHYTFTPINEQDWLNRAIAIVIGMILVAGLVSPLLAKLLDNLTLKPIRHLSDRAEQIALDSTFNYRFDTTRQDEFGRLASSVNTMLEAIEVREAQLKSYGSYLEELVQEKSTQLQIQASEDSMTLCPNRISLMNSGTQLIEDALFDGQITGLIVIDLLRIKTYNQSYGHPLGDTLIRESATRLKAHFDKVYRIGGDEFAIVIQHPRLSSIGELAQKVLTIIGEPISYKDEQISLLVAAGLSLAPDHGSDIAGLLRAANNAMQVSKTLVGSNLTEYDPKTMDNLSRNFELEHDLRDAIANDLLFLVYQPKQHVQTRVIDSVEALARWHHPRLGPISPMEFVAIAEDTGQARTLGNSVLRQAIKQLDAWRQDGIELSIAVNISPAQIMHPDFVHDIEAALKLAPIDPSLLELEITESIMIGNHHHIAESVAEVRSLGVRVAIDDFGTGYSSLSYVRKFTLDTLKLDQSFISDLEHSSESTGIVDAILMLAHTLKLTVVAEGVETPGQMLILSTLGCDYVQGNLLSEPVSADQIERIATRVNTDALLTQK